MKNITLFFLTTELRNDCCWICIDSAEAFIVVIINVIVIIVIILVLY